MSKTNKKVTKKVVTKKATKEELAFAKYEKDQKAFETKMGTVTTELEAISKKYGIKLLAQGYDTKTQAQFTIGSGIKNYLERSAMSNMAAQTFNA